MGILDTVTNSFEGIRKDSRDIILGIAEDLVFGFITNVQIFVYST
jgi:hypothetical protein